DEERVALCIDLVTAVTREARPQQPLMVGQHLTPAFTQLFDETRRALDVGEEEGHGPAGEFRHVRSVTATPERAKPRARPRRPPRPRRRDPRRLPAMAAAGRR